MPDPRPLETIQSWMQGVITHPDGILAGVNSGVSQELIPVNEQSLDSVIGRSTSLGSAERLAVYGNAYFARLLECLAEEFSASTRVETPWLPRSLKHPATRQLSVRWTKVKGFGHP